MKNHIQNTCNPYSAMRKIGLMQTQACVKSTRKRKLPLPTRPTGLHIHASAAFIVSSDYGTVRYPAFHPSILLFLFL